MITLAVPWAGRGCLDAPAFITSHSKHSRPLLKKFVNKKITSTIALEDQIARKKSLSYYEINN